MHAQGVPFGRSSEKNGCNKGEITFSSCAAVEPSLPPPPLLKLLLPQPPPPPPPRPELVIRPSLPQHLGGVLQERHVKPTLAFKTIENRFRTTYVHLVLAKTK